MQLAGRLLIPRCESSEDCEGAAACHFIYDLQIAACLPTCHPLVDECSCDGLGCKCTESTAPNEAFVCAPLLYPSPDLEADGECTNSLDCKFGTACLGSWDGHNACGNACKTLCEKDKDCGDYGLCSPIGTSYSALRGFGFCSNGS
jgi:hypothetical protein